MAVAAACARCCRPPPSPPPPPPAPPPPPRGSWAYPIVMPLSPLTEKTGWISAPQSVSAHAVRGAAAPCCCLAARCPSAMHTLALPPSPQAFVTSPALPTCAQGCGWCCAGSGACLMRPLPGGRGARQPSAPHPLCVLCRAMPAPLQWQALPGVPLPVWPYPIQWPAVAQHRQAGAAVVLAHGRPAPRGQRAHQLQHSLVCQRAVW